MQCRSLGGGLEEGLLLGGQASWRTGRIAAAMGRHALLSGLCSPLHVRPHGTEVDA